MQAEILYEIHWVRTNEESLRIEVTPIRVIERSIAPGASAKTILAIDYKGLKFRGSPRNYFKTEALAWMQARQELEDSIAALEDQRDELQKELDLQRICLEDIYDAS